MSITSVGKSPESHEGSIDQNGVRTARETWIVTTDDPIDDNEIILNAVDPITGEFVPVPGNIWEGYVSGVVDDDLIVRSVAPRQTDDVFVWKVAVEYSTEARDGIFDPRLQVREWNGQPVKRAEQRDRNGLILANSCGNLFDPPPEVDDAITIRRVTRNEPAFNDGTIKTYLDAVNSDTVNIGKDDDGDPIPRAPYTVWMKDMRSRREFVGSLEYEQVTYELHIYPLSDEGDQGGWYTRICDVGFSKFRRVDLTDPYSAKKLDAYGSPMLDIITDYSGARLSQPALLDGDGGELKDAHTQLAAGITAIEGSFDVDDSVPLNHVPFPWWVKIDNEIIRIDDVVGNKLFTVGGRGRKGTTAAAHLIDATVQLLAIFFTFELKRKVPFADLQLP